MHAERLVGRAKRLHRRTIDELPDGAFAPFEGAAFAIRADTLLRWTPEGYGYFRAAAAVLSLSGLDVRRFQARPLNLPHRGCS